VGDWEEGGEGCVPPAYELWDQDQLLKECKKLAIPVSNKDLLVMVSSFSQMLLSAHFVFLGLVVAWGRVFSSDLCTFPKYLQDFPSGCWPLDYPRSRLGCVFAQTGEKITEYDRRKCTPSKDPFTIP